MKVIFLAFSISSSSVSEYFIELANVLSKKNKVFVFADVVRPHNFKIAREIEIIRWPDHPKSLKSFLFLSKAIKRNKPQMMIGNFSAVGTFLLAGYILGVKERVAWCHSISEQFLAKRPKFDKKKWIYKFATSYIANSKATKEDLVDSFKIAPRKIQVFYNAIKDPEKNHPVDPLKITYAGRLDRSKGVDVLLKAIPAVIKEFPDLNLQIIGRGSQLQQLRELSRSLDIEHTVNFVGNRSRAVVLEEFSSSYFTVVPSLVEAFGYVVIESFAVKTPVVGSNTTGIVEIIRSGEDGFLFDNKNSEDLSHRMLLLLRDPQLRERMSNSCHSRFSSKFELLQTVKEINAHFSD